MDQTAFSPSNWRKYAVEELFGLHLETPEYVALNASSEPETALVKDALGEWDDSTEYESWQVDYSKSYLRHAFRLRRRASWRIGRRFRLNMFWQGTSIMRERFFRLCGMRWMLGYFLEDF
jgi:hypothetical protein